MLIGYGTSSAQRKTSRRRKPRSGVASAAVQAPAEAVRVINPLVRKLARDNALDKIGRAHV